ncbi:hypothetical protein E5329_05285 [Petralouisia muris]|uniref:Uncharacterized protein n=1 Tax=Petralouisia muris TaxID=3032872 RepID=A0AC61RZL7_9FIRM|nr:hypothetical protein [Petralouisia muris]TGY97323.1 hypothetical protein E5329_05285 [Petralouisia muris]
MKNEQTTQKIQRDSIKSRTKFSGDGSYVTQQLIDYHVARVKGGCALNIVEVCSVYTPAGQRKTTRRNGFRLSSAHWKKSKSLSAPSMTSTVQATKKVIWTMAMMKATPCKNRHRKI